MYLNHDIDLHHTPTPHNERNPVMYFNHDVYLHRQLVNDRQEALRRAARDTRLLRQVRRDRRLRHRIGPAR